MSCRGDELEGHISYIGWGSPSTAAQVFKVALPRLEVVSATDKVASVGVRDGFERIAAK